MPVDRDELPNQGVELASEWLDRWQKGDRATLDWLTTRTFAGDLTREANGRSFDRARFVEYACALSRGLDWRLQADRVEQREHVVRFDATFEAVHEGVLDLRSFGHARYAPTGRELELPRQRFSWDVVHGRVLRFEVAQGPGLAPSTIVDRLSLGEDDRLETADTGIELKLGSGLAAGEIALGAGNGQPSPGQRTAPPRVQVGSWNGTDAGSQPGSRSPERSPDPERGTEQRSEPIGRRVDRLIARHRRRRRREQVWQQADGIES